MRAPERATGQRVVWGGVVVDSRYRDGRTTLEVAGLPLLGSGRPDAEAATTGRFRVRRNGYVDLRDLPPGRAVTLAGTIAPHGSEEGLPVLAADALRVWPPAGASWLPFDIRFGFFFSN